MVVNGMSPSDRIGARKRNVNRHDFYGILTKSSIHASDNRYLTTDQRISI